MKRLVFALNSSYGKRSRIDNQRLASLYRDDIIGAFREKGRALPYSIEFADSYIDVLPTLVAGDTIVFFSKKFLRTAETIKKSNPGLRVIVTTRELSDEDVVVVDRRWLMGYVSTARHLLPDFLNS